jgi:WD40 repeat protein
MLGAQPRPESAVPLESPYVGLSFYTEADAPLFFGRDAERQVIMGNLRASRLTLLYGASGVGKSSLLRAGVAARLRDLARHALLEGGASCYVPVVFSAWKDDPVEDLAREIEDAASSFFEAGGRPDLLRGSLAATVEEAVRALEHAARSGGIDPPAVSLLVILDQFEEFFLYGARRDTRDERFADQLSECLGRSDLPVNFLISIRDDAYAALGDLLKGRMSNVYGNYLNLGYLAPDAARDAIVKPIERYNAGVGDAGAVSIEPGLVETVLDEVRRKPAVEQTGNGGGPAPAPEENTGQIVTPYLQLVMTALWRREIDQGSRTLRLATLRELRGADEIVARHLDDALDQLATRDREVAVDVLHHLVTPSGTKIALEVGDLAAYTSQPPDEVATVMDKLAGPARILRNVPPAPGKSPDDDTSRRFEIYHDVLTGPINAAVAAAATRRLERDKQAAEERARRERRQARTFKGLAAGFLLLLLLSVAAVVVATRERNHAQDAQQEALSRQLAGQASADLHSDALARGVLLSMEAERAAPTADARAALVRAQVATHDMTAYITGHTGPVRAVAFSPDGRLLASGSEDRTIAVWDPETSRRVAVLRGHTQGISSLAFAPDGRTLASAGADENVMLWDPRTGLRLRTLQGDSPIESVTYSPDGRFVASSDDAGNVALWDPGSERPVRTLHGRVGQLFGVAFAPGGRRLAAAGLDGTVVMWNPRTGRRLGTMHEPVAILSVAFSPGGRSLALGGADGVVAIRDVRTGRTETVLRGARHATVYGVTFSPSGDALAAGSDAQTVLLWRLRTPGRPQVFRGDTDTVSTVAFSPDGRTLASGSDDGRVVLWRASSPPGGRRLVGHRDVVLSVAWSPDGRRLASAGRDRQIVVWDPATGRRVRTLRGNRAGVDGIAFSPDGRVLASGAHDGRIMTWDVAAGRRLRVLRVDSSPVWGVAFSRDGRLLASAGADHIVTLWEARTGRRLLFLSGHSDAVDAVAFSPDSRLVASAGSDGSIIVWDAATGRRQRVLNASSHVTSVAFTPDGKRLLSVGTDQQVSVWDVRSGHRVGEPLTGQDDTLTSVAVAPDGRSAVSAGGDGSVVDWSLAPRLGQPVAVHDGPAWSVAFSPDGRSIASAGSDRTVTVSPAAAPATAAGSSLHRRLCAVVRRNLTHAEWHRFLTDEPYRRTC